MLEENESTSYVDVQKKLTIQQSLLCGSIAGAIEANLSHPLWVLKTRAQQQKPLSLHPSIIYRGISSNVASMVPLTATQVGLHQLCQDLFFSHVTTPSTAQEAASAYLSGAGAALIACPTEMVMTHQGKQVGNGYAVAKELVKQGGWKTLWRGLPATALRDSPFTLSFLVAMPYMKKQIQPYCVGEADATAYAGISSGMISTLASQGFDTVKTLQQTASKPVSAYTLVKQIYQAQGVSGFFKGTVPRSLSVISGTIVLGGLTEKLTSYMCK
ncbi:MAG: hypothetical protein DHS20C10_02420 [marine bacterium B5-7]|nr:MAG: hypothetical protein DHS20C10_02420 [marine bacterium B5-7]